MTDTAKRARRTVPALAGMMLVLCGPVAAQRPLTYEDAIRQALAAGAAIGLARADSAVAAAGLLGARAYSNPLVSTGYTDDPPQYHALFEQPLDFFGPRGAHVRAARASVTAAAYRLELERARIRFNVTLAYTDASAAQRTASLSARAAADAQELARIARARRDQGDASDLDVGLATLNAGQLANRASADSVATIDALITLQLLLGQSGNVLQIALADSLESLQSVPAAGARRPLSLMVADADLRARQLDFAFERRSRFQAPSIQAGFDTHDPTTHESKLLPLFSIAIPLPLLDPNRGGTATARAEVDRATIALAAAERESAAAIARAQRDVAAASARLDRDRQFVQDAERLAGLVNAAYREGAYPITSVLEAQRNVRNVLSQYTDDAAALVRARAALALATTGAPGQ